MGEPCSAEATHVGLRRTDNQDSLLRDDHRRLYAVADGMGGHAAGDVASKMAIRALRLGDVETPESLRGVFSDAHAGILRKWGEMVGDSVYRRDGMGTTLSALVLRGDRALVAHVGDSRVYRIRAGFVEQLTADHTDGYFKNVLANCLGSSPAAHSRTDVAERSVRTGDCFVLCSDGLSNYLDDPGDLVRLRSGRSISDFAKALVAHALDGGGIDNVTVVAVAVS